MPTDLQPAQPPSKPRRFRLATAATAAVLATGAALLPASGRAAGGVSITSYGHSALLIQGGGSTVLLNPFKAVGCASGLAEPRVRADVILASSRLLDEGAPVASGRLLTSPGSFQVGRLKLDGIAVPHDRIGGRRFGQATAWRWKQGGLEFAHLGGTAASLRPEDKVLIGRPDVLIIGVGGGAKVYDGAEAAAVVRDLQPRRVIPVQYLSGRKPANCDQGGAEPFLQALAGTPVQRTGRTVSLGAPLSDATQILLMR
jgi:L-ascorbate metabolism protein UlaG (beta-lactamase superfamily)